MGTDLFTYIQRLELIAFFSGYPFIYAIVYTIAGEKHKIAGSFANRLTSSLPMAYALTGTLFIGLLLKDLYPDYSAKNIAYQFQTPYFVIWGILSVLFWIPAFSKKTIFSLLHSLVFFSLFLKDLFLYFNDSMDKEMIRNDMKIYTISLLLNTATLFFILAVSFIQQRINSRNKSTA